MAPDQQLVELNNISTPWNVGDAQSIGGSLLSQSWRFMDTKLAPYEFSYSHGDAADEQVRSQGATLGSLGVFLAELHTQLLVLGLVKTLGLRVHPGPDFDGLVEVTAGKANINFHPSKASNGSNPDL